MLTITLNNLLYMINHICLVFLQNTIIFTKLVQTYIQYISKKLAKNNAQYPHSSYTASATQICCPQLAASWPYPFIQFR